MCPHRLALILVPLLGGCLTERAFVDQYAKTECELRFGCYDESARIYLEWDTVHDCTVSRSEELGKKFEGCAFRPAVAESCLASMKEVTECPQDLAALEPPAVCADAFGDCPDLSEEAFIDLTKAAVCRWHHCVDDFEIMDACLDGTRPYSWVPDDPYCFYNITKSRECLDGWESLTCDDPATTVPDACAFSLDDCD